MKTILLTIIAASLAAPAAVFTASGALASDIQASVDAFRAALGGANNGVGGSFATGRREINWDGVPDAFSAPNNLPGNFFNVNSPRGVVLSTPGSGLQVSANAASGTPVEFGNLNAGYPAHLTPFSAQRLFTPLGSNIVDIEFFIPGTNTRPAYLALAPSSPTCRRPRAHFLQFSMPTAPMAANLRYRSTRPRAVFRSSDSRTLPTVTAESEFSRGSSTWPLALHKHCRTAMSSPWTTSSMANRLTPTRPAMFPNLPVSR